MKNSTPKHLVKTRKNYSILIIITLFLIGLGAFFATLSFKSNNSTLKKDSIYVSTKKLTPIPSPTPTLTPIPVSKILDNGNYHIFQSFNNCGPASLSMALSFYNINESQEIIGNDLRPYQIPGGDNDDKSVTLKELADYSRKYSLIPYHRPMGNPETVKRLIANDMPVIVRTWTTPTEDIGHFRIIKGYDNTAGTFLQDDSLQNKNLTYTYDEFNEIWKKFNYEFLVLVPPEKQEIVEIILGENLDEKVAWQNAIENSLNELQENPEDIYARFNLSVAYYHINDFEKSAEEFEKVEYSLPFRTLWYQIEPIEAYYELGNYDKVFEITNRVLNYQNRAFSELYILRGKIYKEKGQNDLARLELEKAVYYNVNLQEAQELLNSI